MANNCGYQAKVVGPTEESIKAFIRAMRWEGEYEECGVGRVFECDAEEIEKRESDYACMIYGDCAWSVYSAMINSICRTLPNSLPKITKDLGITVEFYSEECGCEFQEHIIYDKGVEKLCDCVKYIEVFIGDGLETFQEDYETDLDFDEYFAQEEFKEMLGDGETWRDREWDGTVHFGGYPEWKYRI